MPPASRHVEVFPIRAFECDLHGRLLPRTFCLLLQEAASAHAAELGVAVDGLIGRGVAWVLAQLRLEVHRWPTSGDRLTIETWPEAASGSRTERRFVVTGSNGTSIGEAVTIWLVLDLARRRPVRLPDFVAPRLAAVVSSSSPTKLPPIPAFAAPQNERALTVSYSDLDPVRHANNAAFVEWMVECTSGELWESHDPSEVEVHYLAECRLGDAVVSQSAAVDGADRPTLLHRLVRVTDGTEAARARTVWRQRPSPAEADAAG
jgi:acyl-ACP thioesterase